MLYYHSAATLLTETRNASKHILKSIFSKPEAGGSYHWLLPINKDDE